MLLENWTMYIVHLSSPCLLAATGSNGVVAPPQTTSLKSRGLGLLRKLKMSAELLIAIVALLSWLAVGVVMFDFVEYKAVPGRWKKNNDKKTYVAKTMVQ